MEDKEEMRKILTISTNLEYLGIHLEDIKYTDIRDMFKDDVLMRIFFTIPESSTLHDEDKDEETNRLYKTQEGLITITKRMIGEILITSNEDILDDEELEQYRSGTSPRIRFYAKVRAGEVWSNERAEQRMQEMLDEMKAAAGYSEV